EDLAVGMLANQPLEELDEHELVELALEEREAQGAIVADRRDHVQPEALAGDLPDRGLPFRTPRAPVRAIRAEPRLVLPAPDPALTLRRDSTRLHSSHD